jgi:protein AATF/BFR2
VQTDKSRLTTQTSTQTTIVDVLTSHLANPTRLLSRTHQPRSCAPLQLSQSIPSDTKIYDDADFYSLLLKELLEQKAADSITASAIDVGYQVRKEAKTKKNVDTKASKGRKLRYTVHEKLQNFMAPEDRGKWGERQAEELFGSLFGQRSGLGEEDEVEREDDGAEEEGLMLFRS